MGIQIAVVGAGPAGIYGVEALLKRVPAVTVDVFEAAPAPFGLVRYGVAPDHQKIKRVTAALEKSLSDPRVALLANVRVGRDVTAAELHAAYDAVLYATGSAESRALGVPGEDRVGCHGSPQFVAWYNGHPDFIDYQVDLSVSTAAVVGAGNVAIDIARMLLLDPKAAAQTDMPDYALNVLQKSRVRDVHLIIRRGPEHTAFDLKELRDVVEMPGVRVVVPHPRAPGAIPPGTPPLTQQKLELLAELAHAAPAPAERQLFLHFYRAPKEILGTAGAQGGTDQVASLTVEHTHVDAEGRVKATGETSALPVGLVVSAVGYRGAALPGLPFDESSGTVPNTDGRVVDAQGETIPGLYVAGWIKRGPTGVIGTNKACAIDTVNSMEADLMARGTQGPAPGRSEILRVLAQRDVRQITWSDWKRLDHAEVERGKAHGKVREKFLSAAECFAFLDQNR